MKVPATLINEFVHSAVTEDGRHMLLAMQDAEANEIALGINCDHLAAIIDRCAHALSESERIRLLHCNPPTTAEVTWWNLKPREEDDGVLLQVTFGSGGTLSFGFSPPMTHALLKALETHVENMSERPRRPGGFSD